MCNGLHQPFGPNNCNFNGKKSFEIETDSTRAIFICSDYISKQTLSTTASEIRLKPICLHAGVVATNKRILHRNLFNYLFERLVLQTFVIFLKYLRTQRSHVGVQLWCFMYSVVVETVRMTFATCYVQIWYSVLFFPSLFYR